MTHMLQPERRADRQLEPTIGIITTIVEEQIAVYDLLENAQSPSATQQTYRENQILGEIPTLDGNQHRVVLARTATQGTNAAAIETTNVLKAFSRISTVIIVGIAGGVPDPGNPANHVRLGDVVVSSEYGVLQYDFVNQTPVGNIDISFPRPPDYRLLRAAQKLEMFERTSGARPWMRYIDRAAGRSGVTRPPVETDVLLSSTEPLQLIRHPDDPRRRAGEPRIFLGRIASANRILKDPYERDKLREKKVKAVEMESAGVADAVWQENTSFFAIRGISDYCDSNKNDTWKPYAAAAAAAYARALIETIPGVIPPICDPDQARQDLSVDDPVRRTQAAQCLGLLRIRSMLPQLESRLEQEEHPEVRYWIAMAIAYIGGEPARKVIERFQRQSGYTSDRHTQLIIADALRILQRSADPCNEGGIR